MIETKKEEYPMKFKMLGAALSLTAAFGLMACGDDNSTNAGSGTGTNGDDGCNVAVEGNSVVMTTTAMGVSSKQIWTLENDEVTITYEPAVPGQTPITSPAAGQTLQTLKAAADASCKAYNESQPATPDKGKGGSGADAGIGGGDGDGGDAGIGGGDDEYEFPDKFDQCKVTRKGDAVTVEASAAGISIVDTQTLKNGVITETVTYSGADAQKAFKSACADAKEDDPNATCNAATKTVTGSYEDEEGYESVDELEEDAQNECDFLMNPDKYKEQIGDLLSGFEDLCGDDEECHAAFSEL
jgi:hypothetical protein